MENIVTITSFKVYQIAGNPIITYPTLKSDSNKLVSVKNKQTENHGKLNEPRTSFAACFICTPLCLTRCTLPLFTNSAISRNR